MKLFSIVEGSFLPPVKPGMSILDSRTDPTEDRIQAKGTRTSSLGPESSVSKEGKDVGSSKVSLKSIKAENGTPKGEKIRTESVTPKGKTVSPKEEKTPKKEKVSPQTSKVRSRHPL